MHLYLRDEIGYPIFYSSCPGQGFMRIAIHTATTKQRLVIVLVRDTFLLFILLFDISFCRLYIRHTGDIFNFLASHSSFCGCFNNTKEQTILICGFLSFAISKASIVCNLKSSRYGPCADLPRLRSYLQGVDVDFYMDET
jgi:hypothetical protein